LGQFDQAFKIYERVSNKLRIVYNKLNRGNILWRMGNYNEAQSLFDDLSAVASDSKNGLPQVQPLVKLMIAQARLSQRNFPDAISLGSEAITVDEKKEPEVAIETRFTLGLAKALAGDRKEGLRLCDEAVKMASAAGDYTLQSRALLALAEAALLNNDAATALRLATEAQARFARGSQFESEWRAWLIASRASQKLGDKNKSDEQLRNAQNARSKLEQQWGADAFKHYVLRPDIQVYTQ
jgi:tetratricopeptide (TPR) repeat protein